MSNNPLESLLTPENLAAVEPLLNAAIDNRIQPLSQKIDNLAQGIQLLAQAQLEKAGQEMQPQPPAVPEQTVPVPMAVETPTGFAYPQQQMQPAPLPSAPPQPLADKFAAFAPMLMQYLSGQNANQNNNLTGIAETLSAAAAIGNIMNAPMLSGIKMATDMMSLAGRSGIEPSVAAETLGKMANEAQTQNTNGTGGNTPT